MQFLIIDMMEKRQVKGMRQKQVIQSQADPVHVLQCEIVSFEHQVDIRAGICTPLAREP